MGTGPSLEAMMMGRVETDQLRDMAAASVGQLVNRALTR